MRLARSASGVPSSCTSSIATIAPRPRTSPIPVVSRCSAVSRSSMRSPSFCGPLDEPFVLDHVDRGQRGRARHRIAAERAAEPADVHRVHDLGPAGHARDRHAAAESLRGRDEVGHDVLVLAREPRAGAAEAGLHLVGHEHDAVGLAPLGDPGEPTRLGDDEPALAGDRLDDDARDLRRVDARLDPRDRLREPAGAAERVRERRPVDLGRVRPERLLVRVSPCAVSESPSSVRPWNAWSNAITAGRPVAARAIFTAFSTASAPEFTSNERFSCVPGVRCRELFAHRDVALVRRHLEARVEERAACSAIAATTAGCAWPTLTTAMPAPRSIRRLPSTSSTIAPCARCTKIGSVVPTPAGTAVRAAPTAP